MHTNVHIKFIPIFLRFVTTISYHRKYQISRCAIMPIADRRAAGLTVINIIFRVNVGTKDDALAKPLFLSNLLL